MIPSSSDLEYFAEVAAVQHVSRAAARIGISQPSLTLAIKRLENNLGVPLLIRTKRGVKLTEAGKILASQTQLLRQSWHDIKDKVTKSRTEVIGRLTLGCHSEVAIDSLPLFLPSLLEDYPSLEIKLVHDVSRKIVDDIVGLEIDVGIVVNPLRHRDLVIRKLSSDEVTLWVGKGKRATQDLQSKEALLICDPDLLQSSSLLKMLAREACILIDSSTLMIWKW